MLIPRIQRLIVLCAIALGLCILGACSSSTNTTSTATPSSKAPSMGNTVIAVTSVASTPGIGPTVILSPTSIPGGSAHSQRVVLQDRTLFINDVHKSTGSDANSTAIRMTMTMKNTGTKAITNSPNFYALFGAEGDAFGLSTNTTGSFFGAIAVDSSRNGTIVFQVPTGATKSLKLFYRSDVANESVFIPFTV